MVDHADRNEVKTVNLVIGIALALLLGAVYFYNNPDKLYLLGGLVFWLLVVAFVGALVNNRPNEMLDESQ